jgi:UDP-N-acetylmuramyl pentapeptide phosphotransferase/UDP-N-acetylglucosamine-1-phosphate transferase
VGGIAIAASALFFLPAWTRSTHWQNTHAFAVVFGVIFGSMMIGFIGFIWTGGIDLYFKIVIDFVAICLLAILRQKIRSSSEPALL